MNEMQKIKIVEASTMKELEESMNNAILELNDENYKIGYELEKFEVHTLEKAYYAVMFFKKIDTNHKRGSIEQKSLSKS